MPEIIYDTIYNIQLDLGPKSILLEIITYLEARLLMALDVTDVN